MPHDYEPAWNDIVRLLKPHPWHGVHIGPEAPAKVTCYIEMVPTDTVKYEVDKRSGYLRVDRPQRYSNVCPTLYGFMPQTYCGDGFAAYTAERLGRDGLRADRDPLDVCVFTERELSHGDVLLEAVPIGGMRMVDGDEADDKILAVLENDAAYGFWHDIGDCPSGLLDRLKHYFLTYKQASGSGAADRFIAGTYGRDEAHIVIEKARRDYERQFGSLHRCLSFLGSI